MTAIKTDKHSRMRRIDKTLFEAGNQCAKKLYLEVHGARGPEEDGERQVLSEVGNRVVELARQAFPLGRAIEERDFDRAIEATRVALTTPGPKILFDACFRGDKSEVQCDVVIGTGPETVDIVEVKAGTTVKQRHLFDVALQVYTIEAAGLTVGSVSILHLEPRYRHGGGPSYPVQRLFRNVDVTARVRKLLDRVGRRIDKLLAQVDDDSALDLPTGTWCHHPLPCRYYEQCLAEGPECPLVLLPDLTHDQETAFHEQAIEELTQIPLDESKVTLTQRRALRSVQGDTTIIEPFVVEEVNDVEFPLHFLHVQWHMDVLPQFTRQRPWQKLPFQWSALVVDAEGGAVPHSFASTDGDDPRTACIESLGRFTQKAGTVVTYQPEFDVRIRALLDDDPSLKAHVRQLLNVPLIDLSALIRRGVYAPGFGGSFELRAVHRALVGSDPFAGVAIGGDHEASENIRRTLNSRTRSKTRERIAKDLNEYGERVCRGIATLFQFLRKS